MTQKVRTVNFESVLADALTLSDVDREFLAVELAQSIPRHPEYDELWAKELERRWASVESGTAELLDWDEAEVEIFGPEEP